MAAGEERTLRFINKAFLLTLSVQGTLLPYFLQEHFSGRLVGVALKRERQYLKQLALEIRRMHQHEFIHRDLTPYNILVQARGERIIFFYLDNDRTRRYPSWFCFPHLFRKRNLVQLNRFFFPGVSLQDRMRFIRYYLGVSRWAERERQLIRWLE